MKKLMQFTACLVAIAAAGASCTGGESGLPTGPSAPEVSPPSTLAGMVAFVRGEGTRETLMAMNPDGSGVVSLNVQGWGPHVSPDGRKVLFTTPDGAIGVLDLATGTKTVLGPGIWGRWSPDAKKILFWSDITGTKELWTINPDGSGAAQLSDGGDGYHEGDWSPDGSRIVFRRVTGPNGGDLWSINADGTGAAVLFAGDRMDVNPRWSPDGRRIVFNRLVAKASDPGLTSELFVIDADGSNLVRLTHDDRQDWGGNWSPDGSRIAFFRFITPTTNDMFTIRPDGTDLQVLLAGSGNDYHPVYGPAR